MRTRYLVILLLGGACAANDLGSSDSAVRLPGRYRHTEPDRLSANGQHACLVQPTDGKLLCWGQNWWGELGNNATSNASPPGLATAVTTPMVGVAVGTWHVCGLTADGHVQCWGDNGYGQLGNGTTTDSKLPVTVLGVDHAIDVASGNFHSCALQADGAVKCWGRNTGYQLGDGTTTARSTPITVALTSQLGDSLMSDIIDLSAGWQTTCATKVDGGTLCWGSGYALGGASAIWPAHVGSIFNAEAVGVSAGDYHTSVVDADGSVWSAGDNSYGQLGDNTNTADHYGVQVHTSAAGLLGNVIQVSAGQWHTCALTRGGTVYCWGRNDYGQLAQGSANGDSDLALHVLMTNVVALASGDNHTCALKATGAVSCWGNGLYGSLGTSTFTSGVPVDVSFTVDAGTLDVSSGWKHTCTVNADGKVDCWGRNVDGQLGDGTLIDKASPTEVSQLSNAVAVTAGSNHTCAVLADSTAKCWGDNLNGQLGDGVGLDRTLPYPVSGLSNATSIDAGSQHTCAVTTTGGLKCWGFNLYGQVGDGTTSNKGAPTAISLTDVVQVSAGDAHTCAVTTNGLYCWGRNSVGQLGIGSHTQKLTPTLVPNLLDNVVQVGTGIEHTCVLLSGGLVECWGGNTYGQLGDGTTVGKASPVQVNLNDVVAISVGLKNSCALKGDGSVWCWGSNATGQNMTGTTGGSSSSPALATAITGDAVVVSAGGDDSCVLTDDGLTTCF